MRIRRETVIAVSKLYPSRLMVLREGSKPGTYDINVACSLV
jgi:hypothetical protein